ncbi:MAG: DUF362 domain-containing protein [Chloroflexi bacterium]|nr:DUF362 domain-containing protein [Chloroflexota bacterium]
MAWEPYRRPPVVIKPNLSGRSSKYAANTDPRVVRALVDLALDSNADEVFIVETSPEGARFSDSGYDFFNGYDGRVSLVDLADWPVGIFPVPNSMAYRWLYLPKPLMGPEVVFISAAKLKTHTETLATLTMKNLFGLPVEPLYRDPVVYPTARLAMHNRSISQTIVDLNLARPMDFAVVDGIWGMEGFGPLYGQPVEMDVVVAGANPVAVDRTCLEIMGIPQTWIQHLRYASALGLGPNDMNSIDVVGDAPPSRQFALPGIAINIEMPRFEPAAFSPGNGQLTEIFYWIDRDASVRVDILQTSDFRPWLIRHKRTLQDWTDIPSGTNTLAWDGKDDNGDVLPPGRYAARIRAFDPDKTADVYAIGWVNIV